MRETTKEITKMSLKKLKKSSVEMAENHLNDSMKTT